MAKLQKTTTIKAPVEKVFAFMDDPNHMPEIWPSMVEVKDVKPNPKGGNDFSWVYKMAGMKVDGASEVAEHVTNRRTIIQSTKGIESKFTWTYETVEGGTKLNMEVEYTVPVPLLGKLAEAIIVKQNEHEADTLLDNLKNRMEIETPVAAA
jgi:uncharacterized membrane protein